MHSASSNTLAIWYNSWFITILISTIRVQKQQVTCSLEMAILCACLFLKKLCTVGCEIFSKSCFSFLVCSSSTLWLISACRLLFSSRSNSSSTSRRPSKTPCCSNFSICVWISMNRLKVESFSTLVLVTEVGSGGDDGSGTLGRFLLVGVCGCCGGCGSTLAGDLGDFGDLDDIDDLDEDDDEPADITRSPFSTCFMLPPFVDRVRPRDDSSWCPYSLELILLSLYLTFSLLSAPSLLQYLL